MYCTRILVPPTYINESGQIVCEVCSQDGNNTNVFPCPTHDSVLRQPLHPCPARRFGCFEMLRVDAYEDHENLCFYNQKVYCGVCERDINVCIYNIHCRNLHKDLFYFYKSFPIRHVDEIKLNGSFTAEKYFVEVGNNLLLKQTIKYAYDTGLFQFKMEMLNGIFAGKLFCKYECVTDFEVEEVNLKKVIKLMDDRNEWFVYRDLSPLNGQTIILEVEIIRDVRLSTFTL